MQELNWYGLWAAKQAAKGAPVAIAGLDKRFKQVAGDFAAPRDEGSENYSDLSIFGDQTDWVNSLVGNGAPGIQATPDELAWLLYIFHGGETTEAVAGPPAKTRHLYKPLNAVSFWTTWFQRVGLSQVRRGRFGDCAMTQLVVAGSTGAKAVRMTPTLISLDPNINEIADPAAGLPDADPFLFTDGAGAFEIDGTVIRGHSAFELTLSTEMTPVFGDSETVHDLVRGSANFGLSVTIYMDADGQAWFNTKYYGSAAPAAGTKPLKTVGALGSYNFALAKRNPATGAPDGDLFDLAVPGVKWNLPDAPGPNPDGGTAELTLTGSMRRVTGQDPYTIGVNSDADAFA